MALDLKANTAVDVLIGPFVDDSDGKTAETGLTLAQADIKLSKNGQALAQKNDNTTAAHDSDGYYNCELDATDTNTEGQLVLIVHESGALPVRHEFNVMSQAAWDSIYAAKDSGYMDVNVKAVSEDTTAADNLELITEISNITSLTVDASGHLECNVVEIEGADPTDTIRDSVVDDATRLDASSLNAIEAKVDTVDGIVDDILVDTAEIGAAGAGLTAVPWNSNWDTEVESECNDALVNLNLDHLMKVAVSNRDTMPEVVDDTVLANIMTKTDGDTSDFDHATDSLEAIRDKLTDIETDTQAIETDTNELQTDDIPGKIAALENISTSQVNAEVVDALGTDTLSELSQGAPTATPTIKTAIMLLYMLARNKKEVTSTELALYADDGSTKVTKSTLSDDGTTFTEGELATGA